MRLDLYGTLREKHVRLTPRQLRAMYADVRERTDRALAGLDPAALRAVPEPSLNPLDWALGHVAHFYECMVLRHLAPDAPPFLPGHDAHALFDSFRAAHDDRWRPETVVGSDPTLDEIRGYLGDVCRALLDALGPDASADAPLDPVTSYLHVYGILHEHWHIEDFIQTRQTLGYAAPSRLPSSGTGTYVVDAWGGFAAVPDATSLAKSLAMTTDATTAFDSNGASSGYASIPAGKYALGARRDDPWVFDAERWAHDIDVPAFRIAKAPVTNADFAAFVVAGGYDRRHLWSHEGWRWRTRERREKRGEGAETLGEERRGPRGGVRGFLRGLVARRVRGLVRGSIRRRAGAASTARAGDARDVVRGGGVLRVGRGSSPDGGGVGGGGADRTEIATDRRRRRRRPGSRRRRRIDESPETSRVPVGRRAADAESRQPRRISRRDGGRRRAPGRRQRVGVPRHARQRVGVDGVCVFTLPRVRDGFPVSRKQRAVVRLS